MNFRLCLRWVSMSLIAVLALTGSLARGAAPSAIPTAVGGFVPDDGAANVPNQSGRAPSLAFGSLTSGGQFQPWLAFVENNRVVAATFNAGAWQRRGDALNFQAADTASNPALEFAEANHSVPWVAFVETLAGKQQTSRHDSTAPTGISW